MSGSFPGGENGRPPRFKVILTGKLPPPYIGPSVATQLLLDSGLRDEFDIVHFDTSDHRPLSTLAAFDFTNFYLAFKQYADLFGLIMRHRPALVYLPAGQSTVGYGRDAGFIWIAKLLGCKVLTHLRGGYFREWVEGASALTRAMVRVTHRRVDGQIVLGETLRELFEGYVPPDRVFVIPNGGDFPSAEAAARPAEDPFRVLFLSNLIAGKGVVETLEAARIVGRRGGVEFVFAGAWYQEDLRREVERRLQADPTLPVRFVGPVSGAEKVRLLGTSDAFALPTYYTNEGQPWAIVEAMSHGLPIISTRHAAIPEAVEDGINGFLVAKRSPEEIAAAVLRLVEDPALRRRMGEASRRRYEEKFTESRMVRGLADAFRATIERPARDRVGSGRPSPRLADGAVSR